MVDLDKQKEEDGDPARSSNVVLPSAGSTIIDPTSSAETKDESKEHRDEHGNCVLCGNPEPETTSDHRQVTSSTPEWKQHVSLWLGKAVQSSKGGYPSNLFARSPQSMHCPHTCRTQFLIPIPFP